jgi:hypothetical protein
LLWKKILESQHSKTVDTMIHFRKDGASDILTLPSEEGKYIGSTAFGIQARDHSSSMLSRSSSGAQDIESEIMFGLRRANERHIMTKALP